MMPIAFACMYVRQMQFDHRNLGRADRIHQRDRRMGIGSGIQDHAVLSAARFVQCVDQDAFVIALHEIQRHANLLAMSPAHGLDIRECGRTIDLRLTRAEQVEVWSVQDEHRAHNRRPILSSYSDRQAHICPDGGDHAREDASKRFAGISNVKHVFLLNPTSIYYIILIMRVLHAYAGGFTNEVQILY